MIEYRRSKGLEVQEEKIEELEKIDEEMGERKRDF